MRLDTREQERKIFDKDRLQLKYAIKTIFLHCVCEINIGKEYASIKQKYRRKQIRRKMLRVNNFFNITILLL